MISPRLPEQEVSLDWDNYNELPSFKNIGRQPTQLQFSNLQGVTGLEEINKVTLVDTSVSSLSSSSSTPNMFSNNSLQQQKFTEESQLRVLLNMSKCVEEMMEDFTAEDVRKGNIDEVPKVLEEISKARTEFRNAVREYKQSFNLPESTVLNIDNSITAINQSVRTHAHSIWAKVEQLQASSGSGNTHTSAISEVNSYTRDDTEYKRYLFRDQLLYLTESLNLPDNDDPVASHWKSKSESDVCRAMQELNYWQKAVEKLSRNFREYERAAQLSGFQSNSTFISDNEDFEGLRVKVKEVTLAVQEEDRRRNLQSLLPNKTEKVKYPCFSGEPGEDLIRFKEKMLECFRKNRVPQSIIN